MSARITHALAMGAAPMPTRGRVAVFDPPEVPDLPDLSSDQIEVISPSARLHAACAARGIVARVVPENTYAAAIVFLDRARPFARLRIAEATRSVPPGAPVLVDGQKTDGIESALKECRTRVEITDSYVKSHGRLFWFGAETGFDDWASVAANWPLVDGFHTGPGVFSADGIDPGSQMLCTVLPDTLSGQGADLGAGWGFLSARALANCPKISALHLVEDDHRALDAARLNVSDARAQLHWADATRWQPPRLLDFVIMNPPFHTGREADPSLGCDFIAAAAATLSRHGSLWMVANRHLPYEAALASHFNTVTERVAHSGYKVVEACAPKTRAAAGRRP